MPKVIEKLEDVIYPLVTEKAIALITKQNTIVFVVPKEATKRQIKEAVERAYSVKVAKVRTHITFHGEKRAFVKLSKEFKATDLASKLKIL